MRRQAEWIYRAPTDLLISLCWIPLFLLGHVLSSSVGINADDRVRWAVAAVLVFSFLHQPLTFALVYGDRKQFDQRRRLFLWAPPITVGVIALAVTQHLWVVIPSAALWNTVHTLQQRYGLSRIYARKSGYGSAFLDRSVLYAWMAAAVLVVAGESRTAARPDDRRPGDHGHEGVPTTPASSAKNLSRRRFWAWRRSVAVEGGRRPAPNGAARGRPE